jgi:hypothetical protein
VEYATSDKVTGPPLAELDVPELAVPAQPATAVNAMPNAAVAAAPRILAFTMTVPHRREPLSTIPIFQVG